MDAEEDLSRGRIGQDELLQGEVGLSVARIVTRRWVELRLAFREILEEDGPVLFRDPLPFPGRSRIDVPSRRVPAAGFLGRSSGGLNEIVCGRILLVPGRYDPDRHRAHARMEAGIDHRQEV